MRFDDSDMKIAPERPSKVFDSSEGAANAFVREKSNGNMEKARLLGISFAHALFQKEGRGALFAVGELDNEQIRLQRQVLFSYMVNRVIEDMAPNSIVAQSALSAYYEAVREQSEVIYDAVNDSAAYSQYILAGRCASNDSKAIAKVFARLCEQADNAVFIQYGRELAEYFTLYCTEEILRSAMIR